MAKLVKTITRKTTARFHSNAYTYVFMQQVDFYFTDGTAQQHKGSLTAAQYKSIPNQTRRDFNPPVPVDQALARLNNTLSKAPGSLDGGHTSWSGGTDHIGGHNADGGMRVDGRNDGYGDRVSGSGGLSDGRYGGGGHIDYGGNDGRGGQNDVGGNDHPDSPRNQ